MIRGQDLHRALVEYNEAFPTPEDWLKHANLEEDAFFRIVDQFASAMIAFGEEKGDTSYYEVVASTIGAAFAVGLEVGRQFPVTPLD